MEKKKRGRKKKVEEKISEIFEIEKNGEEKIIESHAVEKTEEKPPEEQVKKENKIFKNIVIVMVGFVLMFFVVYLIVNSMKYFEVNGVKFEIVKEGALTFYKTFIPVMVNNKTNADYNFYLRNDPRTLKEKVPIIGNISFKKNMVLDVTTEDLFCGGDWTLAIENIKRLYGILDINLLVKNDSIEYQPSLDYMFITINKRNQTEIRHTSDNSYEININDCEVLPAFERLMLESFIRNKELNG